MFHLVKEVQMPPMFGVDHPTASFLRVLRSGTCSLYQAIFSFSSGWYYEYFLKKPDGYHLTVITPNNTGGKELDEFFADCPALLKKINSNEYRHDRHRYEHMVDDYNGACPPR